MKALILDSYQKLPQLKKVPIPKPKNGEVLVKVAYCGVNQADLKVLMKNYGDRVTFPLTMGSEIVGTLENQQCVAVHPYFACNKCIPCKKGEAILCRKPWGLIGVHRNGGYAEFVTVPKSSIVSLPSYISLRDAAAVTLSAPTAYRMMVTNAQISPGEWTVITAAASGVGIYSCQLAKYMEANIIALAGSSKKLERLKSFGIKYLINYTSTNVPEEIMKTTKNQGIDVLIDTVGGSLFESLLPLLSAQGRTVFCGATGGANVNINLADMYYRQKRLIGSSGFTSYEIKKLFRLIAKRKIKPVIDSVFSLNDIPNAWDKLKARNVFGKILIKVS